MQVTEAFKRLLGCRRESGSRQSLGVTWARAVALEPHRMEQWV